MSEGLAHFLPSRSIGDFSSYVLIEEDMVDSAEITEHPVEIGATVSDHVYLRPSSVTIRALSGPKFGPVADTYAKLRAIWRARMPIDIVTGKAAYRNMVLQRLRANTRDTTEHVLEFTAEFEEVILVSVQTVSVPPTSKHRNGAKTGAQTDGGKKYPQDYVLADREIQGPPQEVRSTLSQATGVKFADSPFDFLP